MGAGQSGHHWPPAMTTCAIMMLCTMRACRRRKCAKAPATGGTRPTAPGPKAARVSPTTGTIAKPRPETMGAARGGLARQERGSTHAITQLFHPYSSLLAALASAAGRCSCTAPRTSSCPIYILAGQAMPHQGQERQEGQERQGGGDLQLRRRAVPQLLLPRPLLHLLARRQPLRRRARGAARQVRQRRGLLRRTQLRAGERVVCAERVGDGDSPLGEMGWLLQQPVINCAPTSCRPTLHTCHSSALRHAPAAAAHCSAPPTSTASAPTAATPASTAAPRTNV